MEDDMPPLCARDEAEAVACLERLYWPEGAVCPRCGSRRTSPRRADGTYRCNGCRCDFTLRAGTVFAGSRLPLHKWLHAAYLLGKYGEGLTSTRLGEELGVRQASAWSLLRRLREAGPGVVEGLIETISAGGGEPGGDGQSRGGGRMAMTRQELAGEILNRIRDGSLRVGDRLPSEREIAARLGTSRGAVREALIVLETLGFIEVRGKEGIFVRTFSEEECNRSLDVYSGWPTEMLPHVFQVRLLLESEAAGLAARNRTAEDLERMAYCINGLVRICRERPDDWNRQGGMLNDLFHKLVIEATHNPVLLRMYEGLLRIITRAYSSFGTDYMVTPLDQWEERVVRRHREILEAIEAEDRELACELMRGHLEITFNKLTAFYQERIKGVLPTAAG